MNSKATQEFDWEQLLIPCPDLESDSFDFDSHNSIDMDIDDFCNEFLDN